MLTTDVAVITKLGLGGLIGVVLGAVVVFTALLLLPAIVILHRRQKRALTRLELGLSQNGIVEHGRDDSHQPPDLDGSLHFPGAGPIAASGKMIMHEKIVENPWRRGHKRKPSEMLSWPLPRRRPSKRTAPSRRMIAPRLSAVIESPRSFEPYADHDSKKDSVYLASLSLVTRTPPENLTRPYDVGSDMFRWNDEPSTWPPAPRHKVLFRAGYDQLHGIPIKPEMTLRRVCSLPSVSAPFQDITIPVNKGSDIGIRSFSHGNFNRCVQLEDFSDPGPVLPLLRTSQRSVGFERKWSDFTTPSVSSNCSLDLKAVVPGDVLRETLMHLDQSNRVEDVESVVDLHNSDMVHEISSATMPISLQEVINRSEQICTAETVRLSRVSSESGLGNSATTIRVLSTPKRNSQIRRVSACGSPIGRLYPSILRDIAGNELVSSREISQTSLMTASSQGTGNNPFTWESPIPPKRSALKGSPTSKNIRRGRSCNVRIASKPMVFHIHEPLSHSPKMKDNISMDQARNPLRMNANVTDFTEPYKSSSPRTLPRPPSVPIFAPELSAKSPNVRLSLTPSSPTLSHILDSNHCDFPGALKFDPAQKGDHALLSSNTFSSTREQDAYVSFPSTLFSGPPESPHSLFEGIPLSAPNSNAPDSPTIPGLTLAGRRGKTLAGLDLLAAAKAVLDRNNAERTMNRSSIQVTEYLENVEEASSPPPNFPMALPLSEKPLSTLNINTINIAPLAVRPTPLSSRVDPSNTEPFSRSTTPENPKSRPAGARPAPPPPLRQSVKALRRENSDAQYKMNDSIEARRYLRLARDRYTNSSPVQPEPVNTNMCNDTAEEEAIKKLNSVWEEGENFWKGQHLEVTPGKVN